MALSVREWDMGDVPAMVTLGGEMHAEAPNFRDMPFEPGQLMKLAEAGRRDPSMLTAFVAAYDEQIIGMMIVGRQQFFFNQLWHCSDLILFVTKAYRLTTRAAPMLIDAAIEWARQQNCVECRFGESVGTMPESVAKLYKHKGFREAGTLFVKEL